MSGWEIPFWVAMVALLVRNDYIEGNHWWNEVAWWKWWKD